ncbi:MAG: carboxylating nicotinate-nucleotide diphosphorylase [Candidatus Latescibacteria bacterium]|nr:carboxylating nicotinate-nucleotide diphosphorylase [Candidatus Latescibacterota bacterium]NIM21047.1 carboxylating nicotinate-nucleotide diphosphorylase [Candidatus Latescibacterota bacterium]NIM65182.1 carboxylating nicotinate-nucleotide diphosphorylase [Candidatus Latescibacterota bacterium]NIO01697.1 carboxylating nicotinate-nucleotide diphosphorylase [Candidatus Latescibacterota bacterium]NIO28214.1 carboxylating nicotinate-nucleotide diphosphorylase [Candidatus Latescibacterota bacteri
MSNGLERDVVRRTVSAALEEDAAKEDVTVSFLEIGERRITAKLLALTPGVLAGLDVAREAFRQVDPHVSFEAAMRDGGRLEAGKLVANISGAASGILSAERVALNFLQRLSGIATLTSKFVDAVSGTGVKILDTRKTTPRLRALEKYAVRVGGGENHRFDLKEMMLVKENHIRAIGGIEALIEQLDSKKAPTRIEVEVDSIECLDKILGAPVDRVMLDNFSPGEVRNAVRKIASYADKNPGFSVEVEVSGGITLDNVGRYAVLGIDFISIGALTHSAVGLNMTIEVD